MAIDIRINSEYKLTSDAMNVILNKRYMSDPSRSKQPDAVSEEKWKEIGYYPTIERALNDLVDKSVRSSEATTLSALHSEITLLRRDIDVLMKSEGISS